MTNKITGQQNKDISSLQHPQTTSNHAEEINKVLFTIADAVNTTPNLADLYKTIHQSLGNILDVTNFFVAIVDSQKRTPFFSYFIDSVDDDFSPITDFDTETHQTAIAIDRKLSLEHLKKSERRFRQLFEHSNDAIIIHTLDGKILDCNKRASELPGYSY